MATESYGRIDDGISWTVYHELWSGPWWWELKLPNGARIESPEQYTSEKQARDAVEDARRQALAGLPPVETMATLRARAEAAEARAAQAEADARLMLVELNGLDSSEGTEVFDCLSDAGLTRAEWDAVDRLPRPSGSDEDWADMLAAVRRILAAVGAT